MTTIFAMSMNKKDSKNVSSDHIFHPSFGDWEVFMVEINGRFIRQGFIDREKKIAYLMEFLEPQDGVLLRSTRSCTKLEAQAMKKG